MPEYADIYALSKERNRASIAAFLDEFIPQRRESADEYEIPQHSSSPRLMFRHAEELIAHCCTNLREVHSIYWSSVHETKPEHAMVFFLPDEHVIYGLSTDASDEASVLNFRERLRRRFGGYVLLHHEACPPPLAADFHEAVRKST